MATRIVTEPEGERSALERAEARWKELYHIGGVAALIMVVLTLAEVIGLTLFPQPATVSEWFALFESRRLVALLDFWGLEVLMFAALAMIYLSLYAALRNVHESYMAIALVLALLGIGVLFATNNPFTMLSLSSQYAAATSGEQRSLLLAAGQAVLAKTNQRAVGGFNMGLFLMSLAGLIAACVMLQSRVFSRSTAFIGILANVLSLADYVRQALTQSEVIALFIILPNALFLMIWFTLVGRSLLRLGRRAGMTEVRQM